MSVKKIISELKYSKPILRAVRHPCKFFTFPNSATYPIMQLHSKNNVKQEKVIFCLQSELDNYFLKIRQYELLIGLFEIISYTNPEFETTISTMEFRLSSEERSYGKSLSPCQVLTGYLSVHFTRNGRQICCNSCMSLLTDTFTIDWSIKRMSLSFTRKFFCLAFNLETIQKT